MNMYGVSSMTPPNLKTYTVANIAGLLRNTFCFYSIQTITLFNHRYRCSSFLWIFSNADIGISLCTLKD